MSSHLRNIAVVGADGNSGRFMVEALLKTGKHTITALTRTDSTSTLPAGITVHRVDYNDKSSPVDALQGQDALVINLGGMAPKETQTALAEAAVEADVGWILPNEWSPDTANEELVRDVVVFASKPAAREEVRRIGGEETGYIAVSTGFWYEWSLAIPGAFGFDFESRKVLFFDDGQPRMSISTWPHVGRAVAGLLSLPIKSENGTACLEHFRNGHVYVSPFTVSQKDMFESVLRVTETQGDDWGISYEPIRKRYADGVEAMETGDRMGFAKMMYGRVFFPDGSADFETNKGTVNGLLGLPREDIDEFTSIAIERSKLPSPWTKK